MSSLKRVAVNSDWEQYLEGSRRRRHFEHLVQMENDEYGELCPTQCQMCKTHNMQCRRYKPGVCDSVTACSFCKARSVSCSHSGKSDTPKTHRRSSVSASQPPPPPKTPENIQIQQYRPMPSPRGTSSGQNSVPSSLFASASSSALTAQRSASPQLLDTCVNRLMELQKRMLQFGNDLKTPNPDMDALQKEQRAQSADVASLMALILTERAK